MKPFEEMTKAEKMKVLEEDYIERQKKQKQKEQRKQKWVKIGLVTLITILVLSLFSLLGVMVVESVIAKDCQMRVRCGVCAGFLGILNFCTIYVIVFNLFKEF